MRTAGVMATLWWPRVLESGRSLALIVGVIFSVAPFLFPCITLASFFSSLFGVTWLLPAVDHSLFWFHVQLVLIVYLHIGNTEIVFYGDAEEAFRQQENILYLSNHQTGVDWIVAAMVSIRHGYIHQLRYIMKHSLKWLPLYGWACYLHGCIFVQRGKLDQTEMVNGLDYLQKFPFWLVIYPEGTRYDPTSSKQKEACEAYAKDNGLKPLRHLLTPKSKGIVMSLKQLRHKLEAIYDVTIFYERSLDESGRRVRAPEFVGYLTAPNRLHIHIQRIPISSVPRTEEELKNWVYNAFIHKDKIMDAFIRMHGGKTSAEGDDDSLLRRNASIPTTLSGSKFLLGMTCWTTLFVAFILSATVRTFYYYSMLAMLIHPILWHIYRKFPFNSRTPKFGL